MEPNVGSNSTAFAWEPNVGSSMEISLIVASLALHHLLFALIRSFIRCCWCCCCCCCCFCCLALHHLLFALIRSFIRWTNASEDISKKSHSKSIYEKPHPCQRFFAALAISVPSLLVIKSGNE